jgi:hypothetical protein
MNIEGTIFGFIEGVIKVLALFLGYKLISSLYKKNKKNKNKTTSSEVAQ